jgi:uncharacterized protein YceK
MAQRTLIGLPMAALLVVLMAGCGTVATSTSTTATAAKSRTATAAAAPSTSTTASPASAAAAAPGARADPTPAGFARYRANGFSFLAPSGMKPARDGSIAGVPRGVSARILSPGGGRVESTSTQIIVITNPRLRTNVDLDQLATSLEAADANDPRTKDVHTNVSTTTVAGAEQVRIVTESYNAPDGAHSRTLFRRTWLMVMPRPGLLMDLVVVNEPRRGRTIDAATVINSFRLSR